MNPKAIETRNCKTPNCDNEAGRYTRGPLALLCDEVCVPAKRAEMARRREAPAPVPAAKPSGSFEQKAKSLVAVGKRLDTAIAKFKPAKATLADAMQEWKSAVRALAEGEAGGS